MRKYLYPFTAIILPVLLLSCGKGQEPQDETGYIKTGDAVPKFIIYGTTDNEIFRSPDDVLGKRSLLLLFDITCPDCQREFPVINQVWENLRNDPNCRVVALSRGAGESTREEDMIATVTYWESHNFTFPVYFDDRNVVYHLFASAHVPRVYAIDSKGVVQWQAKERIHFSSDELTALVRSMP